MVAYAAARAGREFEERGLEGEEDELLLAEGDLESEEESPHFTPPWRPESPILPRVINIRWKWVHRLSKILA